MKLILRLLVSLGLATAASASNDPRLSSWYTVDSGQYARIYRTDGEKAASRPETTWSNGRQIQAQPAFSGVQQILVSANWIYIRSTGLGSQIMGPWYMDPQHRRLFPNLPTDQHMILRLPRRPVVQRNRDFQPLGEVGMTVDGVRIFDANDAFSYSNPSGRDADPRGGIGQGDHIWLRDAYVNEGITFDAGQGHQQNWGRYHYHAEAIALRYELGDHVDFDAGTKTYHESPGAPVKHSPIIGWLHDGYPLYGPYGYANATNADSGIRRMVSGFVLRDGRNGSDDLTQTGRRSVPAWDAREQDQPVALEPNETGPAVSAWYPLGHYIQDYAYLGDLGKTQGQDYDLDEFNGRWCVTPEFPHGTYAYFTTIDTAGKPVYPYAMGRAYRGYPSGRLVRSITEPVTTYFTAAPGSTGKSGDTSANTASQTTTLHWSAKDSGGYQVQNR